MGFQTLQLLSGSEGLVNHPDTMDDLYRLTSRYCLAPTNHRIEGLTGKTAYMMVNTTSNFQEIVQKRRCCNWLVLA